MNFPVISLIKNDNRIYAHRREKDFKTTTRDLIHVFDNSAVIDVNGIYYEIERAIEKGWATFFWGYNPLLKGRTIKTEFVITLSYSISLENFKGIILERLNGQIPFGFWYSQKDIPELKERVRSSISFKEIIDLFLHGIP